MTEVIVTPSRSQRRREAIKEAGRVVYRRDGRDDFTMQAVADEAGCAIGTLYRYFRDRSALLDVIDPDRDTRAHRLTQIGHLLRSQTLTDAEKIRRALAIIEG